jgi:hypothetical protein
VLVVEKEQGTRNGARPFVPLKTSGGASGPT